MNSEFKAILQTDVNNTFFNTDEFCEYHTIDGKKMRVHIDDLELAKRDPSGAKDTDSIYKSDILILVPAEDFGARPKVDRELLLDGKYTYNIEKVVEENGVYLLTLGAYRT